MAVGIAGEHDGSPPAARTGPAERAAALVAAIPDGTFDAVGTSGAATVPERLHGQPSLTIRGLPEVFYDGAEFCPYCAAERWAIVAALSRFGTFSGLGATASGAHDVFPGTESFRFAGSRYSSPYVAFVGLEEYSSSTVDGSYVRIARPSPAQSRLMATHERPPFASGGGFPFVDVANRYLLPGGAVDPSLLSGLSLDEIAVALSDPSGRVARSVDGAANLLAAAVCGATAGHPRAVCTSPGVRGAASRLASQRPLP